MIPYLRSPDYLFEDLPDYPFTANYRTLTSNGLRMHYVDEGPKNGPVVILLHGEPSWSYLYRKMIPLFVEKGYRVIAPDLIGFGKSDKPTRPEDISYQNMQSWLEEFILELQLSAMNIFMQDWGGLLGLRIVLDHPDLFEKIALGNTALPIAIARAYNVPFPDESYKVAAKKLPFLVPTKVGDAEGIINEKYWLKLKKWEKPLGTFFSDKDPITKDGEQPFQKFVPGAQKGLHVIIKDAAHFLQEDAGEPLAAELIKFFALKA